MGSPTKWRMLASKHAACVLGGAAPPTRCRRRSRWLCVEFRPRRGGHGGRDRCRASPSPRTLGGASTSSPRRIHTVRSPGDSPCAQPRSFPVSLTVSMRYVDCPTRHVSRGLHGDRKTQSRRPHGRVIATDDPPTGRMWAITRWCADSLRKGWSFRGASSEPCVNGLSAVACAHDPHAVPNRVTVGHGHAVPACGDGGGEQAAAEPGRIAHVPGERPAGQDPTTVMLAGQRFVCCAVDPQKMPAATGEDTEHDERRSGERAGGRVVHHHRAGARMAVATSRSVCNTCTRGR